MNIILITGASSGIGMEFALQMDKYFKHVDEFWLVARSRDRLEELGKALGHRVRIFPMDITKPENMEILEAAVAKHVIRILVNCAGYGMMGSFDRQELKTAVGMIRLNCEALTELTHRMIPHMKRGSRMIQMASSAAFLPQQDFAVYAASKSYVLSFSRALGEELRDKGIYVTSVCPGPVDTPFFDIAESTGSTLAVKKYTMVSAERVVALALKDSYQKRSLSVCSFPIKTFRVISKIIPHGLLLKIGGQMKRKGL
ncbi:MAG: SDR family NAD(P)-dependent oxidoreductase [Lachnospiraceae bacterium]|nr:SDR family NAD(P)-dependent oxidoreductase [Lachnospiraceae bacterium]